MNLVRPGEGLTLEANAAAAGVPQAPPTFSGVLEHTFPQSVIDAMARGDVLQIVVFSFLFGAACAAIGAKAKPVVGFCQSLADVMLRYTKYVMYLAPVGVGAAMAHAIGTNGAGVLLGLGKLVLDALRCAGAVHRDFSGRVADAGADSRCALSCVRCASHA